MKKLLEVNWYVLFVNTNQEEKVKEILKNKLELNMRLLFLLGIERKKRCEMV